MPIISEIATNESTENSSITTALLIEPEKRKIETSSSISAKATPHMGFNLNDVGASVNKLPNNKWEVSFGIYLPGICPSGNYSIKVHVIHEKDQFVPTIPPVELNLNWISGSTYDLWNGKMPINPVSGTHFGEDGKYMYRFQLLQNGNPKLFWFSDPFARESDLGTFSSFTINSPTTHIWDDSGFKVPHVHDMVVYELHVGEFNYTFNGIKKMLDYLQGLGVNVLELMPFTNVKESAEWGYTPVGYYAPDERFGGSIQLKQMINECHKRGIAVILDAVYAHAHPEFPYNLVYNITGVENPMMGVFAWEFFEGPGTDYRKQFTKEYFLYLNKYYINEYHIDGFRYDFVPGMYDGNVGVGYSWLVYETYQYSKSISRFADAQNFSRIIQCAEHLPDPKGILKGTYSNCCWQNQLMDKAADTAIWRYMHSDFAFLLDTHFSGYPENYVNSSNGEQFPVAPFQYIESHDNPRLITRIAPTSVKDLLGNPYGDRSQFYRIQPYAIALFTANGIPMLWQGQEICENWGMSNWGIGRNLFERPVHWEYFYDNYGKALIRLYRILGKLRHSFMSLSGRGSFYYYNDSNHYNQGVIAFRREYESERLMIFINFSDYQKDVWVPFQDAGSYVEQIDKNEPSPRPSIKVDTNNQWCKITVPSYYGCIYAKQ